jgi:hypothetical protein
MSIPKKPEPPKDVDAFISGAAAEKPGAAAAPATKPERARPEKPKTTTTKHPKAEKAKSEQPAAAADPAAALDLAELLGKKTKTFPLDLPPKLHEVAKNAAVAEKLPLHTFILMAIAEKAERTHRG